MISPKIALSRNILLEPVAKLKIETSFDRDKIENNSLAISTQTLLNYSPMTVPRMWDVNYGIEILILDLPSIQISFM